MSSTKLRIDFVAIGDEILTGKISDTNSTFVAKLLFDRGHQLGQIHVIADNFAEIENKLESLVPHCGMVIVTGGLGPTSDDLTVEAVCRWLKCGTEVHAPSEQNIIASYKARNKQLFPHSLKQALVPKGATVFENKVGHAPGFQVKKGNCTFFFMPGVPHEMKPLFEVQILPLLEGMPAGKSKTWRCLDITESELQQQMNPIEAVLPAGWRLGYRTSFPENHLTLYGEEAGFDAVSAQVDSLLSPYSYSTDPFEIEEVVLKRLEALGKKLALAESYTGGLAASRICSIPGASKWFWGSTVVYQVEAKEKVLGLRLEDPKMAVSQNCSLELATRVQALSGCGVVGAITGYANSSEDPETPEGTVFICAMSENNRIERKLQYPKGRSRVQIQHAGATHLFRLILKLLEGEE